MTAELHTALLRPAVLQILRATGFNYARPAVVDTVTDLAARYILLLASSTAQNAFNTHNDLVPTVQDVRVALSQAGALWPQMSTAEESVKEPVEVAGEVLPFEDLRGVRGFVDWAQGPVNRDIRRIAGFGAEGEMNVEQIAAGTDERVDYLSGKFRRILILLFY
jgi:transcription initiation factor TFIID subunit 3